MLKSSVMQSLFWLGILIYMIWSIKKSYIRFNKNPKYIIGMTIIAAFYIIIYFYTGIIFGFVKSPFSHELLASLKNILMTIIPIVGMEITRSVVLTRNKNNKKIIVIITIFLILAEINYHTLISLIANREELFKYICSNIIPIIANNIVYTYLSLKSSHWVVLIYRFYKEVVILLLPILPDVDWFINGSIELVSSVIVYLLFKYIILKTRGDNRRKNKNLFEKISYIVTLILLITLICFMVGIFRYEPISILSNSMTPVFSRGDVVIFEKISDIELEQLPKNTIIIYQIGNQNIAHRIVDKIKSENTVLYKTKGDSNNVEDMELVRVEQIKGVYKFHVKYIGFPSVWLHEYFKQEVKGGN